MPISKEIWDIVQHDYALLKMTMDEVQALVAEVMKWHAGWPSKLMNALLLIPKVEDASKSGGPNTKVEIKCHTNWFESLF